jgi:hypothetical protein
MKKRPKIRNKARIRRQPPKAVPPADGSGAVSVVTPYPPDEPVAPRAPAPTEPTPAPGPPAKPRGSTRAKIWQGWKAFWALAGPLMALASIVFLSMPQITIEPSVNLDPQQPLAAQFLIANRGKVPVHDVRFSCGIGRPGGTHIGHSVMSSSTLSPILTLAPGESATRACVVESQGMATQVITVSATYRWPLIRYESTFAAHFSLTHGTAGFILVPEK